MLSGARRVRPVIVGCSTAPRTQAIRQSLMLARCRMASSNSRRNWVMMRTAGRRLALNICTQSGTIQGRPRHDHWAKLGLLRYTQNPLFACNACTFLMKFIAPPSRKKQAALAPARQTPCPAQGDGESRALAEEANTPPAPRALFIWVFVESSG